MVLDDGKMEAMHEKYRDSPCGHCKHRTTDWDKFEYMCPFFKNGIIPADIICGKNKHTKPHPEQIGDAVYEERHFDINEFRKRNRT